MARIQLSGTQIPTLSKLNIDGELTLDASAGTSGQILTSAGSGNTPTWNSSISVSGDIITTAGKLQSTASAGDEGGEIFLNKAVTNTTLNGGVTIDVYQNKLRFFEQGGTARGFYIDMTTGASSASTNLVSGGSYTLPAATSTTLGGIELFSDTVQSTAANSVTTTALRTYGLQLNSSGQAVVNVPWTDSAFTGGTLTSNLTLAAGTTSLSPITFQSGTNLTTVTSGVVEYDGTVFYGTSKTNPGRALMAQNYYYISSGDVSIDMSSASLPLSLLTTTTTGITVPAGTTYDYEAMFAIRGTFIATSQTPTITISNLSGTATMAHTTIFETGNNATGFTTASTLGTTRITAGQALTALTTGSRYYIVKMRGVIRVTGSGTAEIAPTIRPNVGSADNGWLVQSGAIFKLTPIGNGTVETVGAWA
jgi:hypothetical protein